MKITMSKNQWTEMGKKAGWIKREAAGGAMVAQNGKVYITKPGAGTPGGQLYLFVELGMYSSEARPLTEFFPAEEIKMMQQDGTLSKAQGKQPAPAQPAPAQPAPQK